MRINKAIQLLESGQPVHYVTTSEFSYDAGLKLAQTWADIIRLNLEHGPFDIKGVQDFMNGLIDGGPTKSGHLTPAVFAELPFDCSNGSVVRHNSWMIKQLLAQGIHGLLLCHTESADAVQAVIEASRYTFNVTEEQGIGRRGHGGQESASRIWGVSQTDYLNKADVWPLNSEGELLIGVKLEHKRCIPFIDEILSVPGISYAEWGPGDMGMSFGFPEQHDPPYPSEMLDVRQNILTACNTNNLYFLNQVSESDFVEMLDKDNVMICKPDSEETCALCREHTHREMAW